MARSVSEWMAIFDSTEGTPYQKVVAMFKNYSGYEDSAEFASDFNARLKRRAYNNGKSYLFQHYGETVAAALNLISNLDIEQTPDNLCVIVLNAIHAKSNANPNLDGDINNILRVVSLKLGHNFVTHPDNTNATLVDVTMRAGQLLAAAHPRSQSVTVRNVVQAPVSNWEALFNNTPGSTFDKTYELFKVYSGYVPSVDIAKDYLGRFVRKAMIFGFREAFGVRKHNGEAVAEGLDVFVKSGVAPTPENLCILVLDAVYARKDKINIDGDLSNILKVIKAHVPECELIDDPNENAGKIMSKARALEQAHRANDTSPSP